MPTIENFATVSYTSSGISETKISNLAEVELGSSIGFTKSTVGQSYTEGSTITYILTISNTSLAAITNVNITDDLGTVACEENEITPLTFNSPAVLLINGEDRTELLGVDSSLPQRVIFTIDSLPANSVANIIYTATVNEYASLEADSYIENTAELTSDSQCANSSASAIINVISAANVSVFKQMSPNPVVCGGTITYTIRIYNYGNVEAENVVLTDTFNPAPANITVSRDGTVLIGTDYTYIDGTLTIPATGSVNVTVPAATFVRDPETCVVSVDPGVVEYVIRGTI